MAKEPGPELTHAGQDDLPYKAWLRNKWDRLIKTLGIRLTYALAVLAVAIIVIIVLFALFLSAGLIWYVSPLFYAKIRAGLSITERKDLVLGFASIAQAAAVGLTGAAGFIGLAFTWRNLRQTRESTQRTLELTEQGQITERFTHAIDQLGKTDDNNEKIEEIRLGGIYALERIAVEEPDTYHWPIMQVLVAYLRRYASWQDDPSKETPWSADIQTVLNVIGRRSRYFGEGEGEPLSLGGLDFSGYRLPPKAHLEGAWLGNSHLESAVLIGAQLKKAGLVGAHLEGAYLEGADLSEADLRGAHLEGAYLWNADLTGANLRDAYLTATDLSGATLSEETMLDPESLEEANGDWGTEVGEITRPNWWGHSPGHNTTLEPGEYSIVLWKTLLHLHALGTEWYSSLGLPYLLTLSPAGVIFAGLGINFFSGPWVCDPQEPKQLYALEAAPKDMISWFENHPLLTPGTQPQEWENQSGGAAGIQFYVEVNADIPEKELGTGAEGPMVPVFPANPRNGNLGLVKGKKNLVIVLEDEDERLVIAIEGPPEEFDKFKDRVDEEVLANLYWGKEAHEYLEGG
jgi:hypothetical protein